MEKSLREKQIREILDEDILINKRVAELTRLRIRGLTDEGQAIQQGRRNADLESKTSDNISKINALLENKINDALSLVMGMGKGSTNPRITHYLNLFNNSNLINLYNSVVNEYRKGKNSVQSIAIIETQFQTLDSNISKLINTLGKLIDNEGKPELYLHREILTYSIYDLIQNHIYTNNYSIITEKDIMANIYKVLSQNNVWKTEIEKIQRSGNNNNLFTLNGDDVNLIGDIADQQKMKQDELLMEKASKAKVVDMNAMKAREIYKNKIEELENDFNVYLTRQQQLLEAASQQYNNNVLITNDVLKPLDKTLTNFRKSITTINTTVRNNFKATLNVYYDNTIAQNYIDTLKVRISDALQDLKILVYVDAQLETDIADAVGTIEYPQFDYSNPNPRSAQENTALEAIIDASFNNTVVALTAIYRNSRNYYDAVKPIYSDILKEKKKTDNEISKLNKVLT